MLFLQLVKAAGAGFLVAAGPVVAAGHVEES